MLGDSYQPEQNDYVMEILKQASGDKKRKRICINVHPYPENRIEK